MACGLSPVRRDESACMVIHGDGSYQNHVNLGIVKCREEQFVWVLTGLDHSMAMYVLYDPVSLVTANSINCRLLTHWGHLHSRSLEFEV